VATPVFIEMGGRGAIPVPPFIPEANPLPKLRAAAAIPTPPGDTRPPIIFPLPADAAAVFDVNLNIGADFNDVDDEDDMVDMVLVTVPSGVVT
jgi:hypothetical protein